MVQEVERFLAHLAEERRLAENTIASYRSDLLQFIAFLSGQGCTALQSATKTNIAGFMAHLKRNGRSPATIARALVSVRALFEHLVRSGMSDFDPARFVEAPRMERKPPAALAVSDIERLLAATNAATPVGLRDRAMLELLYAAGLRVSELIMLRVSDVNLSLAFVRCAAGAGTGSERIVPVGGAALNALEAYLSEARQLLLKLGRVTEALFVSQRGEAMTRQAFWKIVKKYAEEAGIESELSPQSLRSSFAAHLLAGGADVRAVQEMLGHTAPSSTQAYVQAAKPLMKDAYDKAHPRAGRRDK